ncbi:MAG: VWA domain-containing protein [Fimbriimonadales bacterium]|nr:VWA domain-containing protein [Fimbriimonadales bacterium]
MFGAAAFDGAGNCVAFGTAMVNLTPGERKGLVIEMQLTPSGPAPVGGARTPEEVGWIYGAQVVPASDNPLLASASLALRGEGTSALTDSQIVVQQVIAGRFVVNTAPLNFSGGGGSSRKIDVAFVLDTTGSMGEEIAGVRDSVIEFATTLEGSGNDIRVAALTFGDEIRETYDFTSSYEDFRDFIAGLYAEGGGDGPELGLDAVIEASRSLSWRADTERIIIVITDATAHQRGDGTSFSNVIAEEVVNALRTQYTVHVVSSVFPMRSRSSQQGISSELMDSNQRSRSTTTPYDMRNLAPQLGGVWIALPTSGIVDLTELGITELVQNTYRFKFLRALWFDASDAPAIFVNIRREDGWIRIPLGVRFTP